MASLQPKNSGGPATKFWEAPETISALEHVKGWLCKHAKKVGPEKQGNLKFESSNSKSIFLTFQYVQSDPPTAKSIAQLVSQLIQFQEDNLGKGVKNPPFLRLPVRMNFQFWFS